MSVTDDDLAEIERLYGRVSGSRWFRLAYGGRSLGDVLECEPEALAAALADSPDPDECPGCRNERLVRDGMIEAGNVKLCTCDDGPYSVSSIEDWLRITREKEARYGQAGMLTGARADLHLSFFIVEALLTRIRALPGGKRIEGFAHYTAEDDVLVNDTEYHDPEDAHSTPCTLILHRPKP